MIVCSCNVLSDHDVRSAVAAADDLPRIYDASYTTGGHGMGLYLVRRICERYGWRVEMTSDEQRTTASVLF